MADIDNKHMVKARLLVLAKMFYELTDDAHPMSTFEILDYLEGSGVPANAKTLRDDIKLLKSMGIDIVTIPGRPNKYCLGGRLFELPELKLLLDAVIYHQGQEQRTQPQADEPGKHRPEKAARQAYIQRRKSQAGQ